MITRRDWHFGYLRNKKSRPSGGGRSAGRPAGAAGPAETGRRRAEVSVGGPAGVGSGWDRVRAARRCGRAGRVGGSDLPGRRPVIAAGLSPHSAAPSHSPRETRGRARAERLRRICRPARRAAAAIFPPPGAPAGAAPAGRRGAATTPPARAVPGRGDGSRTGRVAEFPARQWRDFRIGTIGLFRICRRPSGRWSEGLFGGLVVTLDLCPGHVLDLTLVLASGCFHIEFHDDEPEQRVVHGGEAEPDGDDHPGLGGQAPVDRVVDQAAEKLNPSCTPRPQVIAIDAPVSRACTAYSTGAT